MSPNDPALRSFVDVAPDSDFPIQNLPYGIFSTDENPRRAACVAIGDHVLDLSALEEAGQLRPGGSESVFGEGSLNAYMALGPAVWKATRARISELLRHDNPRLRDDAALRKLALQPRSKAHMHVPFAVLAFTDFFSSKQHASNAGKIIRGPYAAICLRPSRYSCSGSGVLCGCRPMFGDSSGSMWSPAKSSLSPLS